MLARTPFTAIYLAKPAPAPRKINRDRYRHLVQIVAAILKTGQPTHFAYESACRHGIRSGLCLDGWTWADADAMAAEIVKTALNTIGARRPTWQQGQPEWTEEGVLRIERDKCARCKRPIPEDRGRGSGVPAKYCSVECNNAAQMVAWRKRASAEARINEHLKRNARDKKRRDALPEKPCAYCKGMFRPYPASGKKPESIFCSPRCRNKARSRLYDPDKGTIVHKKSRWREGLPASAFACEAVEGCRLQS